MANQQKFVNNCQTAITEFLSANDTTISVASLDGLEPLTGGDYYIATIYALGGIDVWEIIKITQVNPQNNTVTAVRGQEGTAPQNFLYGSQLGLGVTAGTLDSFVNNSALAGKINVRSFGAKGDGVTNDTVAVQNAINAASGFSLYFPAGIYAVSTLSGVDNIDIEGDGWQNTTLKRIDNSPTSTSIIEFNGHIRFTISKLTFDGNKANNTLAATNITIINSRNWFMDDCSSINAKAVGGGFGGGLVIIDNPNQTAETTGTITKCSFASNDGDGIFVNRSWHINIKDCVIKDNGGGGINTLNLVFPPVANVSNGLNYSGNLVLSNVGSGIGVSGYIEGGTQSAPIFGPGVPASRSIIIANNICRNNGVYGIAYQGSNGSVIGNQCEGNSKLVGFAGGILFNGSNSVCSGNTTRDNTAYGIDAGGSYYSIISNNSCQFEGATAGTSATYINLGASVGCICSNNNLQMQGTVQQGGISYTGIDGDGSTPFPVIGALTTISGNYIRCNTNANSGGIFLARNVSQSMIYDNHIDSSPDANRGIIITATQCAAKNNRVQTNTFQGSIIPIIASASTVVIPDWADGPIQITGSTTINSIQTYSAFVYAGKVQDVQISNQGSGYSPSNKPTVVFTGGGGTGAAATAEIDNGGRLIGVTMTNNGSGYTSAPAVSFTGGVGSGGAGTAIVGCNNNSSMQIDLIVPSTITIVDGGNLLLNGNYNPLNGRGVLSLMGQTSNWIEMSRSNV